MYRMFNHSESKIIRYVTRGDGCMRQYRQDV